MKASADATEETGEDRPAAPDFIDWTSPPHYVAGVLRLALDDESSVDELEQDRRVAAYMALRRAEIARARDYSRPLARVRWVFDRPLLDPSAT